MPKPKTPKPETRVEIDSSVTKEDFSKLSEDQIMEMLDITFTQLATKLEESGVDPDLVTGAFFSQFVQRMADMGDREQFEEILEQARDLPWEDITLH